MGNRRIGSADSGSMAPRLSSVRHREKDGPGSGPQAVQPRQRISLALGTKRATRCRDVDESFRASTLPPAHNSSIIPLPTENKERRPQQNLWIRIMSAAAHSVPRSYHRSRPLLPGSRGRNWQHALLVRNRVRSAAIPVMQQGGGVLESLASSCSSLFLARFKSDRVVAPSPISPLGAK